MLKIYGHPLASFYWKAAIALYERNVSFEFLMVDSQHPENTATVARHAPTGQFPVLEDGDRVVIESAAIIEYLDLHHGDAPPLIPFNASAAIEVRQMDSVFDDYVMAPLTRMVLNVIRSENNRDPLADMEAQAALDKSYGWLNGWMNGREWAAGKTSALLMWLPHQPCSTPIGATPSHRSTPRFAPIAPVCWRGPRLRASSPRPVPGFSIFR